MKTKQEVFSLTQEQKRAILIDLAKEKIYKSTTANTYPLSYSQQALWFLYQLAPQSCPYNVSFVAKVLSGLDKTKLKKGLQLLINWYPTLRTTYLEKDGVPRQYIHPYQELDFEELFIDSDQAEELMHQQMNTPFNLQTGPLLRARLIVTPKDTFLMILTHHIAVDFWSLTILLKKFAEIYSENKDIYLLKPYHRQEYVDYVKWLEKIVDGKEGQRSWQYWQSELAGELPSLNLPVDKSRPPLQTYVGDMHFFNIEPNLTKRIKEFAQQSGVTSYVVLLSALHLLLYRYTGQKDLLIGSPMWAREPDHEEMVGDFMNPTTIRAKINTSQTVKQFLQQIRDTVLNVLDNQYYPFSLVVEKLLSKRDPSRSPIFQAQFVMEMTHIPELVGLAAFWLGGAGVTTNFGGLVLKSLPIARKVVQFDISLWMEEIFDSMLGILNYNTDLFEKNTIIRMGENFKTILTSIVDNSEQPIFQLPFLTDSERNQILLQWNNTNALLPEIRLIHLLFENQVIETPEAIAVVFESQEFTYNELNQRANQLAHYLRKLGVGQETLVGIYLQRSLEMMVALLGILKAGGAYLPLDPEYPQERISFMIADAQVPVIITQPDLSKEIQTKNVIKVILEPSYQLINSEAVTNLQNLNNPNNLAYIIYTSGSTGNPKGVMLSHHNVANFFVGMDKTIGADKPGVWLAVTSISFDISVLELFWTITRGFKVIIQRQQNFYNTTTSKAVSQSIDFSLFYFASDDKLVTTNKYKLLLDGARFADENGFSAVWTPERHFHAFGGLYPNPSVTSAAIATITKEIKIRAGSVVLPLHNPLRIAEEWSVVDNLSNGRVGLSFAAGWNADDFVLAPDTYEHRYQIMKDGIETVRKLWQGQAIALRSGIGKEKLTSILPRPIQSNLPIWITAAGNPDTFRLAGEMGTNLLTHLLGQDIEVLAQKIAIYRQAWQEHGHKGKPHVSLMLHTFVGKDKDIVKEQVRKPMINYLSTSSDLVRSLAKSYLNSEDIEISKEILDKLLNNAFERYFETSGLFGSVEDCLETVNKLKAIGVDEIACLIDFGVAIEDVLHSLKHLNILKNKSNIIGEEQDYSIATQIYRHKVTHLQCTPSLAKTFLLDNSTLSAVATLKKLLLGGEALPPSLAEKLAKVMTNGDIYNMYGPTETTIWSTTHKVTNDKLSIGRPIANTQIYIVDEHNQAVAIGVAGELLIGGDGVARGYLNRPELTAERFIKNPFNLSGSLLYRTGDLARYLPNGQIEFLGRIDHQVKLRGFRIELGEIEATLRKFPSVQEVVVIALDSDTSDTQLIAYLVPKESSEVTSNLLRTFLKDLLPDYMIPALFIVMEKLPVTPNGKIDRRALPKPQEINKQKDKIYISASTDLEKVLLNIWADVLKVPQLSIHDNFFELGGNSLTAVQIAMKATQVGLQLNIGHLLKYQTLAELASALQQTQGTITSKSSILEEPLVESKSKFLLLNCQNDQTQKLLSQIQNADSVEDIYPVGPGQETILYSGDLNNSEHYVEQTSFHLRGNLNSASLKKTWEYLLKKHQSLRSAFINSTLQDSSVYLQVVYQSVSLPWQEYDWSNLDIVEQENAWQNLLSTERQKGFTLSQAPLFKIALIRFSKEHYGFVLTRHHLILDGWSLAILLKQLFAFYDNPTAQSPIIDNVDSYQNYIAWWQKQNLAATKSFFLEQLSPLSLSDYCLFSNSRESRKVNYLQETFSCSIDIMKVLEDRAQKNSITLNTIIQGCWVLTLAKHAKKEKFTYGLAFAARPTSLSNVNDIVGNFTNILPITVKQTATDNLFVWLQNLQTLLSEAIFHDQISTETLANSLNLPVNNLLFDTVFIAQPLSAKEWKTLSLDKNTLLTDEISYLIRMNYPLLFVTVPNEIFSFTVIYQEPIFSQEIVKSFILNFEKLLSTL